MVFNDENREVGVERKRGDCLNKKMNNRRICVTQGCNKPGKNKGSRGNGITYYGKYCEDCHRLKYNPKIESKSYSHFFKQQIENTKCCKCGWDKAPCDRHRINPNLGYTKENVLILCPNCHRLEHYQKVPS